MLHLSAFTGPAEYRAEGLERKPEVTPNPHGCQGTVRAGVGWGLQPLSTWSGVPPPPPRAGGYYSPVQGGRELALGGRMCPSEGCSRGGRSRLGCCQWATGDSSFCRRRRRSSAASGSPSSGSSSVPADSGAGDREVQRWNPDKPPGPLPAG